MGTLSWQDPVYSWKAGPGEVMTVENVFIYFPGLSGSAFEKLLVNINFLHIFEFHARIYVYENCQEKCRIFLLTYFSRIVSVKCFGPLVKEVHYLTFTKMSFNLCTIRTYGPLFSFFFSSMHLLLRNNEKIENLSGKINEYSDKQK